MLHSPCCVEDIVINPGQSLQYLLGPVFLFSTYVYPPVLSVMFSSPNIYLTNLAFFLTLFLDTSYIVYSPIEFLYLFLTLFNTALLESVFKRKVPFERHLPGVCVIRMTLPVFPPYNMSESERKPFAVRERQ
jgi:hypothetical protein